MVSKDAEHVMSFFFLVFALHDTLGVLHIWRLSSRCSNTMYKYM